MAKNDRTVRSIRIVSKDRPTDRFMTAQVRETKPGADESGTGDLYFLVEIHNPWFPNSQIGQTIINTIVREYRRSESSSLLTNFELALRKTNLVLAQITQTGETDWIGNLSSIIALSVGGNIYIAQTGQARGYLLRGTKLSEITEGLDDDASPHPLTTYTNITSGALEPGDRIVLGSSQLPELFAAGDLRLVLGEESLADAGREIVRAVQRARTGRVFAFLLEVDPHPDFPSTTLYLDQSLNTVGALWNRFFAKTLRPRLIQSAGQARTQATRAVGWTRDWLIPRVIAWTKTSQGVMRERSKQLLKESQPLLDRTRAAATNWLPARPAAAVDRAARAADETLAGSTIYRVHHYSDRKASRVKKQAWHQLPHQSIDWVVARFKGLGSRLPKKINRLKFNVSRQQLILLGIALLAIGIVWVSASHRRAQHVQTTNQAAAASSLQEAKAAQQRGETLFVSGQKDAAKAQFLQAITKAQTASTAATTQAQAAAIISQSQKVLDQLIAASRVEAATPVASFVSPISNIDQLGNQFLATSQKSASLMLANADGSNQPQTMSLPEAIGATNSARVINGSWYLLGQQPALYRYQSGSTSVETIVPTAGHLEAARSFASFGSTLYLLDQAAGQIWKHPLQDGKLGEGKAYLKTTDSHLATAVDLAIDGDVYALTQDGSVIKYTKGLATNKFALTDIPTPWSAITNPLALFASSDDDHLYVLENKSSDHPARLLEFKKTGSYTRQLLLPDDWQPEAWSFTPKTHSGLIVSDHKVYPVAFPTS